LQALFAKFGFFCCYAEEAFFVCDLYFLLCIARDLWNST